MRLAMSLAMAGLLWIPSAGQAQYRRDRDWNQQDQNYRSGSLDEIADGLSNSAEHVWSMVRGRRVNQTDQNVDLRNALRNFSRNTRNWASELNSSEAETYRSGAQQLIREAEDISRLVDQTEMSYHLRQDWNEVEAQVYRLSQFYRIPFSPDSRQSRYYRGRYGRDRELARTDPYYGDDNQYGYASGTFRWRGSVDGSDVIYLRGNQVDIRHLDAQPITNSNYLLPVPLPRRGVSLQLRKLQGRGNIQLVQQPSPQTNYTAAVRIDDPEGGRDYYEFELIW